ncbi:MAG: peptidylprolyl isomerase [Ruminococcaceae bacterium]|nr:peptidylprolyl isomerase [Oscillospiraceae bacterium]
MTGKRFVSFILMSVMLLCFCLTGCQMKYENPVMTINFAGGTSGYEGTVKIELYPDKAPNTVRNIIYLVQQGFFDGVKVNMAVAGSFVEIADGSGLRTLGNTGAAPDYAIEGECAANGFETNDLKFEKGSVALSRYEKTDYDSGVDGFFITLGQFPDAEGEFAIFGKVIEGMNVIEDISNMKVTGASLHYEPVYSVKVESITVATKGRKFSEPDKIDRKYFVWNSYCPWWTPDND